MSDIRNFINLRQIYYDTAGDGANMVHRFVKHATFVNPDSIYNISYSLMKIDGQENVVIFSLQTKGGFFSGESKELENVFYNESKS